MKPPIPGIAPPELGEVTSMIVWPSIGAMRLGRLVGRVAGCRVGAGPVTLGRLLAPATIPLAVAVFGWRLLPFVARRYRLTNRRIVIQRGLVPQDGPTVGLDEFDAIRIEILPGQEWLACGEVSFVRDDCEVLRLSGVPRPVVFRETCLKAQAALLRVREVLEAQAVDSVTTTC